jgi:hypothetical protein
MEARRSLVARTEQVRKLIWVYFWLLLFEGSVRKWALPALADPILLIRDPIVIWIYVAVFRTGKWPRGAMMALVSCLAFATFAVGLVALGQPEATGFGFKGLVAALYGLRTDFLHLPLLFIMPMFLCRADVDRIARCLLIVSAPMAILMAVQFLAPSSSWINSGSDEAFTQIGTARGHIRAPGTFSFTSGPALMYALVSAFVLEAALTRGRHPRWLIMSAALATGLAVTVSGSRTTLANVGMVTAFAVVCGTLLQPGLAWRVVQGAFIAGILAVALFQLDVVREGAATLGERFGGQDEVRSGFIYRFLSEFGFTPQQLFDTPLPGHGLGAGTNVGAMLLSGTRNGFSLGEVEWDHLIGESGPIVGVLIIALRVACVVGLLVRSARSARQGNVLPFLLLGACWAAIANSVWGQATTLGFAVFGGGLCAAAMSTYSTRSALPAGAEAGG